MTKAGETSQDVLDEISLYRAVEASDFLIEQGLVPEVDSSPDLYENPLDLVSETVGVRVRGIKVYNREYVGLKVIHDLVAGWRADDKGGRWPVKSVFWAARQDGRGKPWFVSTLDTGEDTFRVWKVSYGGQGKRCPTTTEVGSYKRTFLPVSRFEDNQT